LPCLGDSFTFGVGVENDETFVNHLQASTEIGKAVRLVNLGVPGSALPDQRFIVERRHDELGKPPIYLIFFFLGNDFAGILDSAARKESPVGRESAPNDRTAWRTLSAKVNAYVNQSWLRHSYAIQLTKRVLMQVTSDTRRNLVFYMMEPENTAYHRRVREALQSELARWSEIGRGTQFEVVVMFVPDCYQVIAARREKQAGYYGTEPADLDPLLPNTILAEALKGEGIRFIDPTRDLMEMADAEILFYVKDNHFTAEGHRRFAEAVSRRLDVSLVGLRPRKVTIPRQATKHLDVRRLSNPATIP